VSALRVKEDGAAVLILRDLRNIIEAIGRCMCSLGWWLKPLRRAVRSSPIHIQTWWLSIYTVVHSVCERKRLPFSAPEQGDFSPSCGCPKPTFEHRFVSPVAGVHVNSMQEKLLCCHGTAFDDFSDGGLSQRDRTPRWEKNSNMMSNC